MSQVGAIDDRSPSSRSVEDGVGSGNVQSTGVAENVDALLSRLSISSSDSSRRGFIPSTSSNIRGRRKKIFDVRNSGGMTSTDGAISSLGADATSTTTTTTTTTSMHSDYTRHNSPQDGLQRVLNLNIFNGNTAKNIVQSNKSELYYQQTYPLENCGRMYVLPAPALPCYSVMLPLHFVCKLFDLNPACLPPAFVSDVRKTRWRYLCKSFDVTHVIRMTDNISIFNRRDPVIQEGGVESIETIFVYDNKDADVQYNNTLNCKNKNEDYDGDTNTLSIGKGYESRVEIKYNMSTQMMLLLRNRHVFSQNFLSRFMLRLAFDDTASFNHLENCSSDSTFGNIDRLNLVLELIRRVDLVIDRLNFLGEDGGATTEVLRRVSAVFGRERYARIYLYYLSMNLRHVRHKRFLFVSSLENILCKNRRVYDGSSLLRLGVNDTSFNDSTSEDVENILSIGLEYLYATEKIWQSSRYSHSSNCYSIMDNVVRSIYVAYGESECTEFINSLVRDTHEEVPYYFMGNTPFSFACIINVLSQAKGNFDALLNMQMNLNKRFRSSLSYPSTLMSSTCHVDSRSTGIDEERRCIDVASVDILSRVSYDKIRHNQAYVDNFVEGSKKIPKYCKLAIAMKWALQNLYYYDGDLWMDGEIVVDNVTSYFSVELFTDINLVLAVLTDEMLSKY